MTRWITETFTDDVRRAAWNALAAGGTFMLGVAFAAACGSFVMWLFWNVLSMVVGG